ncbi:unnamed protein product [Closterium sp. NIES-65]|nr:unnamed protein product [Closterium sp. NIES-65]
MDATASTYPPPPPYYKLYAAYDPHTRTGGPPPPPAITGEYVSFGAPYNLISRPLLPSPLLPSPPAPLLPAPLPPAPLPPAPLPPAPLPPCSLAACSPAACSLAACSLTPCSLAACSLAACSLAACSLAACSLAACSLTPCSRGGQCNADGGSAAEPGGAGRAAAVPLHQEYQAMRTALVESRGLVELELACAGGNAGGNAVCMAVIPCGCVPHTWGRHAGGAELKQWSGRCLKNRMQLRLKQWSWRAGGCACGAGIHIPTPFSWHPLTNPPVARAELKALGRWSDCHASMPFSSSHPLTIPPPLPAVPIPSAHQTCWWSDIHAQASPPVPCRVPTDTRAELKALGRELGLFGVGAGRQACCHTCRAESAGAGAGTRAGGATAMHRPLLLPCLVVSHQTHVQRQNHWEGPDTRAELKALWPCAGPAGAGAGGRAGGGD